MHSKSPFFLLDSFSAQDLDIWEAQKDKILRYHWDLYNDFAYQRHKIADQLRMALLEATIRPYEFKGWQRQVSLSALELALIKKDSISIVSVNGKLESIIDLQNPSKLKPFLNLIKKFSISEGIIQMAKNIGIERPSKIKSLKSLIDTLLEPY